MDRLSEIRHIGLVYLFRLLTLSLATNSCFTFSKDGAGYTSQSAIPNYTSARDSYFWPKLYNNKGTSLYCNIAFSSGGYFLEKEKRVKMTVEHAYPADWIAEHNGCSNRKTCKAKAYKLAEADLHNLWPAHGRINSSRGDKQFAELPDKENHHRFQNICADFERSKGTAEKPALVEPRDIVKGEIARSMLYMHDVYGLGLFDMKPMLLKWQQNDPVSKQELDRNRSIFKLQGTYNHWIEVIVN